MFQFEQFFIEFAVYINIISSVLSIICPDDIVFLIKINKLIQLIAYVQLLYSINVKLPVTTYLLKITDIIWYWINSIVVSHFSSTDNTNFNANIMAQMNDHFFEENNLSSGLQYNSNPDEIYHGYYEDGMKHGRGIYYNKNSNKCYKQKWEYDKLISSKLFDNDIIKIANEMYMDDDELNCPITKELMITPIKLNCDHVFEKMTVLKITNNKCPLCRSDIVNYDTDKQLLKKIKNIKYFSHNDEQYDIKKIRKYMYYFYKQL